MRYTNVAEVLIKINDSDSTSIKFYINSYYSYQVQSSAGVSSSLLPTATVYDFDSYDSSNLSETNVSPPTLWSPVSLSPVSSPAHATLDDITSLRLDGSARIF